MSHSGAGDLVWGQYREEETEKILICSPFMPFEKYEENI